MKLLLSILKYVNISFLTHQYLSVIAQLSLPRHPVKPRQPALFPATRREESWQFLAWLAYYVQFGCFHDL